MEKRITIQLYWDMSSGQSWRPLQNKALSPRETGWLYSHPMTQIGEYGVSFGYDYFGSRRNGALAEFLSVPETNLFRLPDHVSLLHAGMVEPAAVSLHAVRKLNIRSHASALVIGGGPIGVMTAQWLKILGCSRVFIAEPDPKKIEIIQNMDI